MTDLPPPPSFAPPPVSPSPQPVDPLGRPLGLVRERFFGLVLDTLVLLPVAIASYLVSRHHSHVVPVVRHGRVFRRREFDAVPVWQAIAVAIPSMAYVTLMIGLGGRTLGQRARHLRVVRASDGGAPGVGAAAIRWAVAGVPALVIRMLPASNAVRILGGLWGAIVLAWMLWDKRRQGLHDHAAGLLVIADHPPPGPGF